MTPEPLGQPLATLFRVDGLPIPQGWVRAFSVRGVIHYAHGSPGLAKWRKSVADKAKQAAPFGTPTMAAVRVAITFDMPRPKDHRGAHGLKPWAIGAQVTKRPDLDRLIRAVLDAITGVLIVDDAQVVYLAAAKRYADSPGALVFVTAADAEPSPPTNLEWDGFLEGFR